MVVWILPSTLVIFLRFLYGSIICIFLTIPIWSEFFFKLGQTWFIPFNAIPSGFHANYYWSALFPVMTGYQPPTKKPKFTVRTVDMVSLPYHVFHCTILSTTIMFFFIQAVFCSPLTPYLDIIRCRNTIFISPIH